MSRAQVLSRIMKSLRVTTPGALDDVIKHELYNTMEEFFRETDVWKQDVVFTTDPDMDPQEYILTPDTGRLLRLIEVKDEAGATKTGCSMPTLGILSVESTPDQAENWTATLSTTVAEPLDDNGYADCPDELLERYLAALTDGTAARLHAQPAKPYTSPPMAAQRFGMYRRAVNFAKLDARNKNMYGAQAWRFPKF